MTLTSSVFSQQSVAVAPVLRKLFYLISSTSWSLYYRCRSKYFNPQLDYEASYTPKPQSRTNNMYDSHEKQIFNKATNNQVQTNCNMNTNKLQTCSNSNDNYSIMIKKIIVRLPTIYYTLGSIFFTTKAMKHETLGVIYCIFLRI